MKFYIVVEAYFHVVNGQLYEKKHIFELEDMANVFAVATARYEHHFVSLFEVEI